MTGRSLRLGPGGEFDRLRAIFAALGTAGRELGDDSALLSVGGRTLAISIDLSLEGVHFRTDWLDFKEIGFRAAGDSEIIPTIQIKIWLIREDRGAAGHGSQIPGLKAFTSVSATCKGDTED